ncbi:MAG TPA: transcription elongation factor GreA [Clostridia bacterium]|nr:transcription elongation factor GreA [Clostridia bacterium]
MSEKEILLTAEGLKSLEEELEHLKTVKRHEIAQRIKQAIEFGDISENSEYEDAKNEQAFIEGRIITLSKLLRNAKLIENEDVSTDKVGIGSTVKILDLDYGDQLTYTIVGSAEANPSENRISNESPVGKALLGQSVGSEVEIVVPAGVLRYKILEITK